MTQTSRLSKIALGVGSAVAATAAIGSVLTKPDAASYKRLRKPSWQPPAAAFPIAWTALYADIAVVETLVLKHHADKSDPAAFRNDAIALGTNLALNAGWSGVFFRSQNRGLSTVWAALLAVSSADLARRAGKVSGKLGLLLSPYAAWTGFATALTGRIWGLNRSQK